MVAQFHPTDDVTGPGLIDLSLEIAAESSEELARQLLALAKVPGLSGLSSRRFRMASLALADRCLDGRLVAVEIDLDEPEEALQ